MYEQMLLIANNFFKISSKKIFLSLALVHCNISRTTKCILSYPDWKCIFFSYILVRKFVYFDEYYLSLIIWNMAVKNRKILEPGTRLLSKPSIYPKQNGVVGFGNQFSEPAFGTDTRNRLVDFWNRSFRTGDPVFWSG